MEEHSEPVPWARAVVRGGRITLNPWKPSLMQGGPARAVLAGLAGTGAVVADLYAEPREDGREDLVVEWLPGGRDRRAAQRVLLDWAAHAGYARVWLPGEVLDLGDEPCAGGLAAVDCPTCGLRWEDDSHDFWAMVRGQGHFPAGCPVCNGSLPEWEIVEQRPAHRWMVHADDEIPF